MECLGDVLKVGFGVLLGAGFAQYRYRLKEREQHVLAFRQAYDEFQDFFTTVERWADQSSEVQGPLPALSNVKIKRLLATDLSSAVPGAVRKDVQQVSEWIDDLNTFTRSLPKEIIVPQLASRIHAYLTNKKDCEVRLLHTLRHTQSWKYKWFGVH